MSWLGLGKPRTKFGKWCDKKGLTQEEIAEKSGVSRNTIGKLCNDANYSPKIGTINKIILALKKAGHSASPTDFWT